MKEQTLSANSPTIKSVNTPSPHKLSKIILFVVGIILIAIIGVSAYLGYQGNQKVVDMPIVQPTQSPISSPSSSYEIMDGSRPGWKMLIDHKRGFSIEYPEDWFLVNRQVDKPHCFALDPDKTVFNYPQVCIEFNPYNRSFDYLQNSDVMPQNSLNKYSVGVIRKYEVDGLPAIEFVSGEPQTDTERSYLRMIYINHSKRGLTELKMLTVSQQQFQEYENIMRQILSTFRFVGEETSTEWQTYRNEEFGFEFQYQNSLYLESLSSQDAIILSNYDTSGTLPDNIQLFNIAVSASKVPANTNLTEWATTQSIRPLPNGKTQSSIQGEITTYQLNSKDAAIQFVTVVESEVKNIYIQRDDIIAMFSLFGGIDTGSSYKESPLGEQTLDQILSTFQFTD